MSNVTGDAPAPGEQPKKWYRTVRLRFAIYGAVLGSLGLFILVAVRATDRSAEDDRKAQESLIRAQNALATPALAPTPAVPPVLGVGERQRAATAILKFTRARVAAGAAFRSTPDCDEVRNSALTDMLTIVNLRAHPDAAGATPLLAAREAAIDCLECTEGVEYGTACATA